MICLGWHGEYFAMTVTVVDFNYGNCFLYPKSAEKRP